MTIPVDLKFITKTKKVDFSVMEPAIITGRWLTADYRGAGLMALSLAKEFSNTFNKVANLKQTPQTMAAAHLKYLWTRNYKPLTKVADPPCGRKWESQNSTLEMWVNGYMFVCERVFSLALMNELYIRAICYHGSIKQPQITSGNMLLKRGPASAGVLCICA